MEMERNNVEMKVTNCNSFQKFMSLFSINIYPTRLIPTIMEGIFGIVPNGAT
jgi:hypothetical protein